MLIIDKKYFELYRYTLAKVIFLKFYEKEFSLKENILESNLFKLIDKKGDVLLVSLLGEPKLFNTNVINEENPNIIYYQKNQSKKDNKWNCEIRLLSDEFNDYFNSSELNILVNPGNIISNVHSELLHDFIEKFGYFDILSNEKSVEYNDSIYKYRSKNSVKNNSHNINDGKIDFCHPSTFNDPFDCNCFTSSNANVSNAFRVLCTTPNKKNILLWSYYGENHKGYCFEYSKNEIINEIRNYKSNGICIIGNVEYKQKRPNYKSSQKFSYSNLKFLIDCTFTKFENWKHEEEFRFVIIDTNNNLPYLPMYVPIKNVYNGCEGDGQPITDSNGNNIPVIKLKKDDVNYILK